MKKNQDIGQKVGELLKDMFIKLSKRELNNQLTEIAENILNFLFVLKSRGKKIDLANYRFDQMIEALSNISDDDKKNRQILKKHLSNFLHNLRYFNCINNMPLFNPEPFFRSKCKVINNNQTKFVKAEIGLENVGATCYMNATLQAFLHDPALRDSFRYGDAKKEYDNRFNNLLKYYIQNNLLRNNNLKWTVNNRLADLVRYKGNWSNAPSGAIPEIKLILKCFADDEDFYKILKKYFGSHCEMLPSGAIDMSYEFFLLSNQADNRVEKIEKSEKVDSFFGPQRFKDLLSVANPLFKGIAANDAKDLVNFLIMQWHEEQNRAKLNQDKNPENIANYIRSFSQQIYTYINTMQYNYNMRKTAMSCNNGQLAEYTLSNVYSCKRSIQFLTGNIIQYAQMINNIDKKYCNTTSAIIQSAQCLFAALGGYQNIDNFCNNFNCMRQYTNSICSDVNTVLNNSNDYQIDQTKQGEVLEAFKKDFFNNNRSAISDQFYAVNRQKTNCSSCNIPKYNFQIYFFLVFPLEEVRKHSYGESSQNSTVTLADCFKYDKEQVVCSGENSMYCNHCKKSLEATIQTTLTTVPKNLILLFNRGKGIEFKVNINYPELFDQYDIGEDFLVSDQKYTIKQAYSTVKHFGESGMSGHFIMDGTSERDGSLNRYNDDGIQDVDNRGMPYLVFYRDMEPNEVINRVLKKVSSDRNLSNYLETIAIRFSELGKLDIRKENNNESRRLRFSYLLMQAVLPDLVKNKKTGIREYKSLPDQQVSNLICAIFDLIKYEQNFDDKAMEIYRKVIQSEKTSMQNAKQENIDIKKTISNMKFRLNQFQPNNMNNKINNNFINTYNNNINEIKNNNINNINTNNNTGSTSGHDNVSKCTCVLEFTFKGNIFKTTIDDIVNDMGTIEDVFGNTVGNNFGKFQNYKNLKIELTNQIEEVNEEINKCKLCDVAQYMIGGVLQFNVSEESVLQSRFSWWQMVLEAIFIAVAIASTIFELYIIAVVSVIAALLTLFLKQIFSCCRGNHDSRLQSCDYVRISTKNDYKTMSKNYNQGYLESEHLRHAGKGKGY